MTNNEQDDYASEVQPSPTQDQVTDQATPSPAAASATSVSARAAKVPHFVFDRQAWTIFRVVLGGVGILSALAGTGVLMADQHAAYWDGNPFSAKAQIIRESLQFWFGCVVAVAALIHVGTEIWQPENDRKNTRRGYLAVFVSSLVLSAALSLFVIPWWAKIQARPIWYLGAVKSQTNAYWHARSLVERNGGEPTDNGPISDSWRANRLKTAERYIRQIERLFEVTSRGGSLAQRLEAIAPIFASTRPSSGDDHDR